MRVFYEIEPGGALVSDDDGLTMLRIEAEALDHPIFSKAEADRLKADRLKADRAEFEATRLAEYSARVAADLYPGATVYQTHANASWVTTSNGYSIHRDQAVSRGCRMVTRNPPVSASKPLAASEPEAPLTPHQLAMIENVKWRCAIIASPEAQARPAATRRMLEAWSPKSKTVEAARRFLAGLPSESTPLAVLAAPAHPATLAGGLDRAELRFRRRVEIYAAGLSRKLNDPRDPRNPAGKLELRNIRSCLENAEASGFALSSLMKASGLDPRKYMEN